MLWLIACCPGCNCVDDDIWRSESGSGGRSHQVFAECCLADSESAGNGALAEADLFDQGADVLVAIHFFSHFFTGLIVVGRLSSPVRLTGVGGSHLMTRRRDNGSFFGPVQNACQWARVESGGSMEVVPRAVGHAHTH